MGRRFEFIFQGLSSNRRRRFGSRVLWELIAFYEGSMFKGLITKFVFGFMFKY